MTDRNSELQATISNLNGVKRKLENDIQHLRTDTEEAINELRNSEGKLKTATSEVAKLTEQLNAHHVCIFINDFFILNFMLFLFIGICF